MDAETHDRIVERYWMIRTQALEDPDYAQLQQIADTLAPEYETALRSLPEEHRMAIEKYITCRESLNSRLLELACSKNP